MSNLKENIKAAQIDLIKDLGIDQLELKQKEELLAQIGEILQQRVVLRIIEELPEEKQDDFKEILEKAEEHPEQLDKYLEENIPGVEDLILNEIGEYKKGASDFMKNTLKKAEVEVKEDEKDQKITEASMEVNELKVDSEPVKPTVEVEEDLQKPVDLSEEKTEEDEKEELNEKEAIVEMSKTEENLEKEEVETIEPVEAVDEMENKAEIKVEEKAEGVAEDQSSDFQVATSGIEQEQEEKEAQIIEENKIENIQKEDEELDLSNELEKMTIDKKVDEDKKE